MINVLFVCLGNICRSPMAEGIFNDKIRKLDLQDRVSADSAGTANYHIGADPDPRTLETLRSNGIEHRHGARQVLQTDGKIFDYILAMDHNNLGDLKDLLNSHSGLFLMRSFDGSDQPRDVPDPYYGGQKGFDEVYEILNKSIDGFLDFLQEKHAL